MTANILAVDDSPSMRSLVREALELDGHRVTEACDGRDALARLESSQDHLDLVITDLYMPIMDGLTLVKAIRDSARYRFTPVVLLTTENGEDMKQRGREAGATGWLVKPFRIDELRDVVTQVVSATGRRAPDDRA
jgi:two-component system chemotaxis response regulator CheY